MRLIASSLASGICAHRVAPHDSSAVIEQYLHAWNVYSYVCPRVSCVLRELQLKAGQIVVNGSNLYADRQTDYRVQGIGLFCQAIVAVEPHVVRAFGDLVCRCLAGNEDALERLPALKSVVSSYIQLHDCSCLFAEFLPQEATRSATQRMGVQPADDQTELYTRPDGLEETILKARYTC